MSNLQYDNFPKFIVSLGIVIITIPFIVLLFFLQESTVLLIAEDELSHLTEVARNTIALKQHFCQWISSHLILLFCLFEVLGITTFLLGCKLWYTLQQKIDKKQDIDYETAKMQLKKLSSEEREQKLSSDINELSSPEFNNTENISVESISLEDIIKKQETVRQQNNEINTALRQRYKIVEENVIHMIKEKLNSTHITQDNVKIGYFSFDAVSIAKHNETDYIFDIRYTINPLSYGSSRLRAINSSTKDRIDIYQKQLKRNAKAIIIVVTPCNVRDKTEAMLKKYIDTQHIDLYCIAEDPAWFSQTS